MLRIRFIVILFFLGGHSIDAQMPKGSEFTNCIGMKFGRIEAGSFQMGFGQTRLKRSVVKNVDRQLGDFDEKPTHKVTISHSFYMGKYEVTNEQYEQFDPSHRQLRGELGFSINDLEAVVYVSWNDAVRFCKWLSKKEGLPYRLPTEAEWEYACRAGTTTAYHTGDFLPNAYQKNVLESWLPDPLLSNPNEVRPLAVGQTSPNTWGLFDMHGNVEEWCSDWYGRYDANDQIDPIGMIEGDFKVTRGGSHSTEIYYLRSSNRMGTLPEDCSWLIGFRVVLGEKPVGVTASAVVGRAEQRLKASLQLPSSEKATTPHPDKPYFRNPRKYIKIPPNSNGPLYSKINHSPSIVACPNGDLLAVWYSCLKESGRELTVLASRLRKGTSEWTPAFLFWDAPDRNDHSPVLWFDGKETIYHFVGLSAAATWGNLATIMRTSTDNGFTWSKAQIIFPEHGVQHRPVDSIIKTQEGFIALPCDTASSEQGGTSIYLSKDSGQTWNDAGGSAAGIHAGIVQLKDGRLMALGRSESIKGKMPKSISSDMGKSWTNTASPFPIIKFGQRLTLMRLKEGPLFLASFTKNTMITDSSGNKRLISGLFGALSFDEGETWPIRRAITDDGMGRRLEAKDGIGFHMGFGKAEPIGYLSSCQDQDGIIHLITGRQHYSFNFSWLRAASPSKPNPPTRRRLATKKWLAKIFTFADYPSELKPFFRFTGSSVKESAAVSFDKSQKMRLLVKKRNRAQWVDETKDGFAVVNSARGFTAEIKLRVIESTYKYRGIDFEIYTGDGSASGNRFFISITKNGVYWLTSDRRFRPLLRNINNSDKMHVFRLAVREDQIVQIYRDQKLIGTMGAIHSRDGMLNPKGSYMQWGKGSLIGMADAFIEHVSYDLSGPLQPSRDETD